MFTKNGVYSSRSGYKFLDLLPVDDENPQRVLPPLEKRLWSSLWKIKAPAKIRHFLWKALAGAVAVMERLQSRGIQVDTTCKVCNGGTETICHLLFSCPMAKDTWGRAGIKLPTGGFSSNSVFLNLYHLLEQSKKFPKNLNVNSFPWILWHLWKARNGLAFEKVQYSSMSVLMRAKEEAKLWFEINFPQNEAPQSTLQNWTKPAPGFLKCNVGVSWISPQENCGVAWILRDEYGKAILHSRRAFSNVGSMRNAELMALQWAVNDMVNTRQRKITFESSCCLARDTFLNIPLYREYVPITNAIKARLGSLQDWNFHHCDLLKNTIAQDIAVSVTKEHRSQSYIAAGPPSWLSRRVAQEAV